MSSDPVQGQLVQDPAIPADAPDPMRAEKPWVVSNRIKAAFFWGSILLLPRRPPPAKRGPLGSTRRKLGVVFYRS